MTTENENNISLSTLRPNRGARRPRKRLGVGNGSGLGKTCGKGHKGQNARSGCKRVPGFEGGQMPIHRRLPKVGFTSRQRVLGKNVFSLVQLKQLAESGESEITLDKLGEMGLLRRKRRVKVLGGVEIDKKITVETHAITASARAAIEKAGGQVKIIEVAKAAKGETKTAGKKSSGKKSKSKETEATS